MHFSCSRKRLIGFSKRAKCISRTGRVVDCKVDEDEATTEEKAS